MPAETSGEICRPPPALHDHHIETLAKETLTMGVNGKRFCGVWTLCFLWTLSSLFPTSLAPRFPISAWWRPSN